MVEGEGCGGYARDGGVVLGVVFGELTFEGEAKGVGGAGVEEAPHGEAVGMWVEGVAEGEG